MQTKEHQQPFFKRLTKDNSQSAISLNQHSQGFTSRNNDLDSLHSSNIQNQNSSGNGERLISLHAKLHQEADRIRKWKNQIEIELKQKDWKILEAMQTSESLRKSILELQLQNESLSLKLQEEINGREEVLQKLNATRDLINILKDYSSKTEERLLQCETERTELKYLEKEHIKNFEDLSEKFRNLEISAEEDHNRFSKELSDEVEEKNKMKLEWQLKFTAAEGQLKELMENCEEKDIEIRDIRTELQKDNEKIYTMGLTIDNLDKQLITCQEEIDKSNCQLSELKQKLEDEQVRCLTAEKLIQDKEKKTEDCITQKHEIKRKFQEAQETYEKRISGLEEALKSKQNELMDYKDRLLETENYLGKAQALIEEVKCSKDMLLVGKTDIEKQLTEVKIQKEKLIIQQDENYMKLVEMSHENMELKSHVAVRNEKVTMLERDVNNLNSHLSAKCEEVKILVEKLMRVTEEFETERYEHSMVQLELAKTKDNFSRLEMNLSEKRHEISQLEQQLKASEEKYEDLRKELENKALSDKQVSQTIIQQEQKMEEQEMKLANLQAENLENAKSMKKLADESVRKQEQTIHNCDHQIAEMMSTLEKYKKDNEKILAQKDKEISALKCKLKEIENFKKQEEEQILILKSEADELKKHLEEEKINVNDLKIKFKERDELIQHLQNVNREKNEELAQLHKNLDDQQISKCYHSCTAVQTSPKFDFMEITSKPISLNLSNQQPKTPISSYINETRTPMYAMMTPRKSSLKSNAQVNSAMKKRKVVFYKEKESNSGCESLSSELMEAENIQGANQNLRKTTTRTAGKFFKFSPKERMKKEKEDLSWFEMDSVFSFGPED